MHDASELHSGVAKIATYSVTFAAKYNFYDTIRYIYVRSKADEMTSLV